ncbi:hypothetical protein [Mycobacterium arosiense]|uniref:hypothetical protein n=1 Tax=Mycobacterium arosiense TaxID=425468 RepID=UPI001474F680|nr:hypothetical protein [Mycobacterium arosiense]
MSLSNVDWDANASRFGIAFHFRNFATRHNRVATGAAYPLCERFTRRPKKRQAAAGLRLVERSPTGRCATLIETPEKKPGRISAGSQPQRHASPVLIVLTAPPARGSTIYFGWSITGVVSQPAGPPRFGVPRFPSGDPP